MAPWRKPWTCQTPANLLTRKEYRGLNVFTLALQGFPSRFWLTFNQTSRLSGRIRKGEKSSPVIFWNVGDQRETTAPDGTKRTLRPFLLRYYSVFNLSQRQGIVPSPTFLRGRIDIGLNPPMIAEEHCHLNNRTITEIAQCTGRAVSPSPNSYPVKEARGRLYEGENCDTCPSRDLGVSWMLASPLLRARARHAQPY